MASRVGTTSADDEVAGAVAIRVARAADRVAAGVRFVDPVIAR
jgi:hypothetical protein